MSFRYDVSISKPQKEIYLFDEKLQSTLQEESNQYKLIKFKNKLNLCGHTIIKEYRCKQCEDEGFSENLLAFSKGRHDCKIRYCSKPDCICQRFAEVLKSLESIKRFENLRTLHHFVIGFKKISIGDFKNNFDKIKKEQERVMNTFIKKIKNIGVKIEAYRVLDISKGRKEEGEAWDKNYYIHYHFVAIPFKRSESSIMLTKIHAVRKLMIKRQRKQVPFHFQSFGLINKKSLLSYISLRSIGLYKKHEPEKEIYKFYTPRDLRKSLKEYKFMLLNELINEDQYLKYFFQHRHLNKIGDLPTLRYGSNRGDNITFIYCKKHGKLDAHDREVVSVSVEIDPDPPPDNLSLGRHEFFIVNASKIEVINKETGKIKKLNYRVFRKKPIIKKIRETSNLIIEYYNPLTTEKFKGSKDYIYRELFKKEIEREKRKEVLDIRKFVIIKTNDKRLQSLEEFKVNKTNTQRASEIIEARYKNNNNEKLNLNHMIDLIYY